MSEPRVINLYSVSDEYGEFSNFAAYPIVIKKKRWPTSEHYFQGQKFENPAHREEIRKAKTPMIAARLGRDRKRKLRRDWESVKDNVMRDVVRAKFTQQDELRLLLLSTGDAKLVEHHNSDTLIFPSYPPSQRVIRASDCGYDLAYAEKLGCLQFRGECASHGK